MWEARAAAGRTEDLLGWVLAAAPAGASVYRAAGDAERVVVIDPAGVGVVADPPADLLARPAHSWDFQPVPR